jgi:L,D-peptidoglycan transpeptidase YkuD (ErfK/YbiS/YcfS/YnhG family)
MFIIKKFTWLLLGVYSCCFSSASLSFSPLLNSNQLLVVETSGWDAIEGKLQRFTRESSLQRWRKEGKSIPVVIGKRGMGLTIPSKQVNVSFKKEGDGKTPAGLFNIGYIFGFKPRFKSKMDYIPITNNTICVDDEQSPYYNQLLDSSKIFQKNWRSAEYMRRVPQYQLGAVIEYNHSPIRKVAGSCIFLHIWKNPTSGTAGCIAMQASNMKVIIDWLEARKNPMIAIFPLN